jgi:hypothetical protein
MGAPTVAVEDILGVSGSACFALPLPSAPPPPARCGFLAGDVSMLGSLLLQSSIFSPSPSFGGAFISVLLQP